MKALPLLVAALAASAILAITAYLVSLRSGDPGDEVARRLSRYGGEEVQLRPHASTGNAVRDLVNSLNNALNPILARTSYTGRLAEDLQKADLRIKSSEWILGVLGAGFLLALTLGFRFQSVLAFVLGFPIVWLISGIVLRYRQSRRSRNFDRQLGDTIILLSNALKAGYSFAQALSTVSKSAQAPIGEEFARATREIALGISTDDALNHMVQRNKSEDFDFLVTAVQIQRVVGGNLAEVLDTIAYTIRERVRIKGEIRTLTAQARASGYIISILPIALAVILSFISPDYFRPMLTQTGGQIMLAVGLMSMAFGFALIQKIVKIEV